MLSALMVKEALLSHAKRLGFDDCRVSAAVFLEEEAPSLEAWLRADRHGSMRYMENHFDKRLDPRLLVPGAKSVISLRLNYFPVEEPSPTGSPKISRYAYGEDYHTVVKDKLFALLESWKSDVGSIEGRCFVDSAPVLERAWAKRSGVGWVGKNAMVLTKGVGSYYFLAELIVDIEVLPDSPVFDHCGTCTRCLDACPTQAIVAPSVIDSNKCISHATIELHDAVPASMRADLHGWAFGCDICQEVCPWNRHSTPHKETRFSPTEGWTSWAPEVWKELSEETFGRVFGKSALQRAGYKKFLSTLRIIEPVGQPPEAPRT